MSSPDVSEATYQDRIEQRVLVPFFGREAVEREPTLPSDRRPDFIVTTPAGRFAIEVENGADTLLDGAGQALAYAAEVPNATPVLIAPPAAVDSLEADLLDGTAAAVVPIPLDPDTHAPDDG